MAKPAPISGFPEWLPEERLLEEDLLQRIRTLYSNYGFVPIETPAVELVDTLSSKGVVEREIYVVKRYHADEQEESNLALHFDLTVPFARYVAQHFSKLVFPFKRYQLQKVWRGERPQKGRFREFYQFDIDCIARDELPLSCDAEVLQVFLEAFSLLNLGEFSISVNNRKILHGAYESFGLKEEQRKKAITAVDKISKIGPEGVAKEIVEGAGVERKIAEKIIEVSSLRTDADGMKEVLGRLGISSALFEQGVEETSRIFELIAPDARRNLKFDLSMARGLDYYTGIIFETHLQSFPQFGSVASGGRYDDLASQFISQKLPGVGGSIGVTRLMDLILSEKLLPADRKSTAQVLVAVYSEEQRARCNEVASELRKLHVSTEVYFKSPKLGKQIEYADAKGIPFVLFISQDGDIEVKDIVFKQQVKIASLREWVEEVLCRSPRVR